MQCFQMPERFHSLWCCQDFCQSFKSIQCISVDGLLRIQKIKESMLSVQIVFVFLTLPRLSVSQQSVLAPVYTMCKNKTKQKKSKYCYTKSICNHQNVYCAKYSAKCVTDNFHLTHVEGFTLTSGIFFVLLFCMSAKDKGSICSIKEASQSMWKHN